MKQEITLTADIIIQLADGSIVQVKRKNEPYKGAWALPGGMMDDGETIEQTAVRVISCFMFEGESYYFFFS